MSGPCDCAPGTPKVFQLVQRKPQLWRSHWLKVVVGAFISLVEPFSRATSSPAAIREIPDSDPGEGVQGVRVAVNMGKRPGVRSALLRFF